MSLEEQVCDVGRRRISNIPRSAGEATKELQEMETRDHLQRQTKKADSTTVKHRAQTLPNIHNTGRLFALTSASFDAHHTNHLVPARSSQPAWHNSVDNGCNGPRLSGCRQ